MPPACAGIVRAGFRLALRGGYFIFERKKLEKNIEMKDIAALLSDVNFIRLQKSRSAFNAFGVLKLKHHEIRHSNVLAWLFKPQESHKFGSAFLEQFLLKLTSCADAENPTQTENIGYALRLLAKGGMHVRVRREEQSKDKKRVDLQIECFFPTLEKKKDDKEKVEFVILIENKIHSREHDNQLADYLSHAKDVFKKKNPDVKIIPVYLTLDENDEPSEEVRKEYFHITYGEILEILETLSDANDSEHEGVPSTLFIRDYIKTLKELLNMNTEEQEYAKEIYSKYRDTIDFICANGENCITDAGKQFVEQNANVKQDADFKVEAIDKSNAHFFPFTDPVLKDTKGGKVKDWRNGAVCGYYFQLYTKNGDDANEIKGTLALKIEVGPFEDSNKRLELFDILKSKDIKYSRGTNDKSMYTRLSYGKLKGNKVINDVTDVEEVAAAMKELFKETKEMREKLHEAIEEWKKQPDIKPNNEKQS